MRSMGRPQLALLATLAMVLGALAFDTPADVAAATGEFRPTGVVSLSSTAPGAHANINSSFNVRAPDYNFGSLISYTPDAFDIATDAEIPDGALVGVVNSQATLGLINGPCATVLPVSFNMLDATVDDTETVVFEEQFQDAFPAPNPDDVDKGVVMYPEYLTRIFNDGAPILPIARLYGATVVANTDVSLNFLIFEPGTTLVTPGGTVVNDPALGYPSVTILQAIGDPQAIPMPGSITDFCTTLLSSSTIYGMTQDNPATAANEAGTVYRTNPGADGTFNFTSWGLSQRDADTDGLENGLDTCTLIADPTWNPRINDAVNDPDLDGIPNSCDPTPNENTGFQDHDGDGFQNRQDNCPLVSNGFVGSNQHDTDLDGIGDDCDTIALGSQGPDVPDGERIPVCLYSSVSVGAGGSPTPATPWEMAPCTGMLATLRQGDVDCSGSVSSVDALKVLRVIVKLPTASGPNCPPVGSDLPAPIGDVDCNDILNALDALKMLRHIVGLPNTLPPGCPEIGSVLS